MRKKKNFWFLIICVFILATEKYIKGFESVGEDKKTYYLSTFCHKK
jgi:hypothetical protein